MDLLTLSEQYKNEDENGKVSVSELSSISLTKYFIYTSTERGRVLEGYRRVKVHFTLMKKYLM